MSENTSYVDQSGVSVIKLFPCDADAPAKSNGLLVTRKFIQDSRIFMREVEPTQMEFYTISVCFKLRS
jgi:hypothetical protein